MKSMTLMTGHTRPFASLGHFSRPAVASRLSRCVRRSNTSARVSAKESESNVGATKEEEGDAKPVEKAPAPAAPQAPATPSEGSTAAASTATVTKESNAAPRPTSLPLSWLDQNPSLARKVLSMKDADAAAEMMVDGDGVDLSRGPFLKEEDCLMLINAALDKGNLSLALSIHESMQRAAVRGAGARNTLDAASMAWPPASVRTTAGLVLGLCRRLNIEQAVSIVEDVKIQGLPQNTDVDFGQVISSPLAPDRTLTVVQPREGQKLVCDAFSKYEYELFTGVITSASSEATTPSSTMLFNAAKKVGLQWAVGGEPVGAIHQLTLQAPDGTSRTFRVATSSADVPGQKGERLTMVCSPFKNSSKGKSSIGILTASPPDTKPGQAMSSTNHKTGALLRLLPPPAAGSQPGIPSWVLPAFVVFAGGDAASSLVDPALPAIIAGSVAFSIGSAVTGARVLIPKLKQLPDKVVSLDYVRQKLLGEYNTLESRINSVVEESEEDIRVLARLWQLQSKMEAVSGAQTGAYGARIERVAAARSNIENRLEKKLELLDGYCRVMKMIEIEVEMDMAVPDAEVEGIEQQLDRLQELEALRDEWKIQAEARDEIERLLKS